MSRFIFFVLLIVIKFYLYISLYRLTNIKFIRCIAIVFCVASFLSVIFGFYYISLGFGGGLSSMTFIQNFSIALMLSFFICEMLIVSFYLLQDLMTIIFIGFQYFFVKKEKTVKPKRRQFLKKIALLIGGGAFSSFLYGITWGKYNYKVVNQELCFDDLPDSFDGFRIAQISDIHAGSFDNATAVRRGFDILQKQNADLILFTGDLVNTFASEIEPYIGDLKKLTAPYGKFSILGNHDYSMYRRLFEDEEHAKKNSNQIKAHHKSMNFQLLLNKNVKLKKNGEYIRLIGVENWGRSHHFAKAGDLDLAIQGCEDKEFSILMSHDPTHWEDKVLDSEKHIHLTLSGHTHGLQMGISLPEFKWSPIKYFYKYWAGLYNVKGKYLYVNRGFGFLAFAGRVGMFPEITIIELKKNKVI
ncbi:MAG: metallophosphoesterase [Saprospiraceae bacterium]|nr:metallophosphoesterase [Saprospiraceae bacterium]